MEISDKAATVAALNAIAALAKRLTGDEMLINVRDDSGNYVSIRPTYDDVQWISPEGPGQCAARE
jgi:hypothetical protein